MDEPDQERFNAELRALAFKFALEASLRELSGALGPHAKAQLGRMRAVYIRDIKNFTPSPNVPDSVMIGAVDDAVRALEQIFDKVTGQISG